MGVLKQALTPPTAYAAKKTNIWEEVQDRIDGAMFPAQLALVEAWITENELNIPEKWHEPISELIEKRYAELETEDISQILRDRWDF
jgi:hypothetical protein